MLKELAGDVDAVAVCSAYLRDTFAPHCPQLAAKTMVIFNGVDTQVFIPREEIREQQTILFVGRFHQEKGVLQLVQAYRSVLRQHPGARLLIAGTTGFGTHDVNAYVREVHELASLVEKNAGGHIQFAGYLHHDRDLPELFQRATVFTSPSLFGEPFGLVNAEAMACGTVVVGSNRGGIPEVLGDSGRMVNPEEIHQYAAELVNLLTNVSERKHLSHGARARAQQLFDWSVIARNWHAVVTGLGDRTAPALCSS